MKAAKVRISSVTPVQTRNSDGAGCLCGATLLFSEGWTKAVGPSKTPALLPSLAVPLASLLAPRLQCSRDDGGACDPPADPTAGFPHLQGLETCSFLTTTGPEKLPFLLAAGISGNLENMIYEGRMKELGCLVQRSEAWGKPRQLWMS